MIIVAGQIHVRPECRDAFLAASIASVAQARRTAGCLDFVVAADPLDPARVNDYE
jgi:quinol monooxygenase YgiN